MQGMRIMDGIDEIWLMLKNRSPFQSLCPIQVWNGALDETIEHMDWIQLVTTKDEYALAYQSGLHLWNDSLDRSHTLSQNIENETGSFLHGMMHRMEGDFSNAKYWFSDVTDHPVYALLQPKVIPLIHCFNEQSVTQDLKLADILTSIEKQEKWQPSLFIDAIALQINSAQPNAQLDELLRTIQWLELCELLEYTYTKVLWRQN